VNWSDEQYVKVYKRETLTILSLDWDARSVLRALLLKLDGAGVMETGNLDQAEAVALQLRAPVDVVRRGLPALIACGTVVEVRNGILLPNFVAAQEATKTERLKKADQRQRDADQRRFAQLNETTESDVPRSPAVSRAVPLQPSPAQPSPPPPPAQPSSAQRKKSKARRDNPPDVAPTTARAPSRIGKLHAFFLEQREIRFTAPAPDGLDLGDEAPADEPPNWGRSAAALSTWVKRWGDESEEQQDSLIKAVIATWLEEPYWAAPPPKDGKPGGFYPWGAFISGDQFSKAADKCFTPEAA
jgi:hypothetical protein